MARNDDEETPWTRQLLVGVGVLVAVALVIGGVVSVLALGAAKVTGIDEPRPTATQSPSLFIPTSEPTTKVEQYPDPEQQPSPEQSLELGSGSGDGKRDTKVRAISLQAFPQKVPPGGRINLTGVYENGEGARLQVQRFERSWIDFPVTASVTGGQFTTYITTSHTGRNRFRVVDTAAGRKSNEVRVTIG